MNKTFTVKLSNVEATIPVVVEAHGCTSTDDLIIVEQQCILMYDQVFTNGDGIYTVKATYIPEDPSEEQSGYWHLTVTTFKEIDNEKK